MTHMTITAKQVQELKAAGRVVFAYPRKKEIVVDGFKRYAASPAAIAAAKAK